MNLKEKQHGKSPETLAFLVDDLRAAINQQQEKIDSQERLIQQLQEQLALAKHRHYGKKSEKDLDGAVQHDLFDEAVQPDNTDEIVAAEEVLTTVTITRKKPGRKPLPKDLPRVEKHYDLDEADKICPCGCALTAIGTDVSEQLEYIPAKMQVIAHVRHKYACKACEETVKVAKLIAQPLPKSIASPGLLAYVLVAKYQDHLPLYRQEKIFARLGIELPRNTLSHWMIKAADCLSPLYQALLQHINQYDVAFADETTVQVLKEQDRKAHQKSYMWCLSGGPKEKRATVYHYDPGRSTAVLHSLLTTFTGFLHSDGYVAYEAFAKGRDVRSVGCWAHARRRFVEITKLAKSSGIAQKMVRLIQKLYGIEALAKEQRLNPEALYQLRQERAKSMLDKIKKLLDEYLHKTAPKQALGLAIRYVVNHWQALTRYLDDGRLHIDNNFSERAVKPFVIGRKNWLFSDSVAGVKAGEVIYSLIQTCAYHQVEPYAYFKYVLSEIPRLSDETDILALLPFNLDKKLLSN